MPRDLFSRDALEAALAASPWLDEAQEAAPQTSAPAPDQQGGIGPWPYVAAAAGQGLDAWSTLDAFHRGGRETNPLIGQSPARLLALKAGMGVGIPLIMRLLARKPGGGKAAAKWLGYGSGALGGGLAAHNFRVTR